MIIILESMYYILSYELHDNFYNKMILPLWQNKINLLYV